MPLYEYHCNNCDHDFEKIVSFSEANRSPICPQCQGHFTQKKISQISFIGGPTSSSISTSTNNCGSSGGFR